MTDIKIETLLEHEDSIKIKYGFTIHVFIEDLSRGNRRPYKYDDIYDEDMIGEEFPVTYVIRDNNNFVIARFIKEDEYTCYGGDEEENAEIYKQNIKKQAKEINRIVRNIDTLIRQRIDLNEDQNKILNKSLEKVSRNGVQDIITEEVMSHEKFPVNGDITIEFISYGFDGYYNRQYIFQEDYDEHSSYLINDINTNVIACVKASQRRLLVATLSIETGIMTDGDSDEEDIKIQNDDLKMICSELPLLIEQRIADNEKQNEDLKEIINGKGKTN